MAFVHMYFREFREFSTTLEMDNLVHRINTFVCKRDQELHRRTRESQKTVRNALQSEMRGMAEFININGRLYRYGFISSNPARTRQLCKAIFSYPAIMTAQVHIQITSWDDVDPAKLKLHLQSERARIPPPPLLSLDDRTLQWLQGAYTSLLRLNQHWGTRFTSWEDVTLDGVSPEVLQETTEKDIHALQQMLVILAKTIMTPLRCVEYVQTPCPPGDTGHGRVECVFARMVAHGRDLEDTYLTMLMYLHNSVEQDTFTPLPPGKHVVTDDATKFVENFYMSDTERARDWGDGDIELPITTAYCLQTFKDLVDVLK